MKYKNAKDIFPDEILREIMKYVDGQYIYIPKKKENNDKVITEYRQEIDIISLSISSGKISFAFLYFIFYILTSQCYDNILLFVFLLISFHSKF